MMTTKTTTMTATSYSTWLLGPARATTEIRYRWLSKPPETTISWFHAGPIDSKPWERSVSFDVINTITNTIYHCLRTHLPGRNRYSTFGNSPHPNDFKTISIATDIPMTWFLIITTALARGLSTQRQRTKYISRTRRRNIGQGIDRGVSSIRKNRSRRWSLHPRTSPATRHDVGIERDRL